MSIKIGSTLLKDAKLGSKQISKIYNGSNLLWSKAKLVTLTIKPNPSDATVSFSTGIISGNTCQIPSGSQVSYTVSKFGYQAVSDTVIVEEDQTITARLTIATLVDDSGDWAFQIINDKVYIVKYLGTDENVTVPTVLNYGEE